MASADLIKDFHRSGLISHPQPTDGLDVPVARRKMGSWPGCFVGRRVVQQPP
jgi:hypothetical protein